MMIRILSKAPAMATIDSLVARGSSILETAGENSIPHIIYKVLPISLKQSHYKFKYTNKTQMIQIAQVPYRKTYKFPLLSDSMALVAFAYLFVILASFFMVYSVHNFYLSHTDEITLNPSLNFTYQYHVTIKTSKSIYSYSNIYQQSNKKAITFSYLQDKENMVHSFDIKWEKPMDQAVTKASLLVYMSYQADEETQAFGMVQAQGKGANIADLNIVGLAKIREGGDAFTPPPTSSILSNYDYNVQKTLTALQRDYSTYLGYTTTHIVNNLPTNLFTMNFVLKYQNYSLKAVDPSILGQLVWSWAQFFPVAFILYLIITWILTFCLRENLLNRSVHHEKRIIF